MLFVDRPTWGALPPKAVERITAPIQGIFVHHTGAPVTQTVAEIQRFHMFTKNWKDVAYSWLVDQNGRIYRGRGWGVVGGHTEDWNRVSHAVCWIGNSETTRPSAAALRSLHDVCAEHQRLYGGFVRPHNAVNSTLCPGKFLTEWVRAGWRAPIDVPPPDLEQLQPKPEREDSMSAAEVADLKKHVDTVVGRLGWDVVKVASATTGEFAAYRQPDGKQYVVTTDAAGRLVRQGIDGALANVLVKARVIDPNPLTVDAATAETLRKRLPEVKA